MSRPAVTASRAGRWRRFWQLVIRAGREFAAVPAAVVAGFLVVAVISIVGDEAHLPVLDSLRRAVGHVIGKQASSATLQAVATGLVTVTSITFSVLLLAVQQTAASLSPVVFDQFVRRRSNQAFLGFFVGLALYAYVVLAAVQDPTPPILGAFVATVLTVVAMLILLVLVYGTIDQMRPTNVLSQLHDRVLEARRRESELVRRTRRHRESRHPVSAQYRSQTNGYVNRIDLDLLAGALSDLPDAEIELRVTLGSYVAFDDVIAEVHDDDEQRARNLADQVRNAIGIDRQRDLEHDATTGLDQIANIGWTSGSTAKHNPQIALATLDVVRDLATRWLLEDPGSDGEHAGDVVAVVYPDNDLERILQIVYSFLIAASESRQHMEGARALDVYRELYVRASPQVRAMLRHDLDVAEPILAGLPASPELHTARKRLACTLSRDDAVSTT